MPYRVRPLADRLWEKVVKKKSGCWEFQGAGSRNGGYGCLVVGSRTDGTRRTEKAHRIAWTLTYGDPGDLFVLHTCDNPPCCNLEHLFLGTNQDNMLDMYRKGRGGSGRGAHSGEDHHGSKLTAKQVRAIRKAYAAGGITQVRLASQYGIAQPQIGRF